MGCPRAGWVLGLHHCVHLERTGHRPPLIHVASVGHGLSPVITRVVLERKLESQSLEAGGKSLKCSKIRK